MKSKRFLIISVEVKVREHFSRLVLALEAISRGYTVIFGNSNTIESNFEKLPRGIFLDKSISLNKKASFQKLIERGFKIVSIDEEGLMCYNNHNKYITQRVSDETLGQIAAMFVWGKAEAEIIEATYPQWKDKLFVSGNPRVDVMKAELSQMLYEKHKNNIKKKYGRYIFFPSNFTVNHALGKGGFTRNLESLGRIKNDEDRALYEAKFQYFQKMFDAYSDLIEAAAQQFPGVNLIVRPHPSEAPEYWHILAKKYPNLFVEDEPGPVTPWLMGAEMVIHSSCTTGLESYLVGTYTLAYLPDTDHEYAKHISNEFSDQRHTEADILKVIDEHFNQGKPLTYTNQKLLREATEYIDNIGEKMSIGAMMDVIDDIEPVTTEEIARKIKQPLRKRLTDALASLGISKPNTTYNLRKYPGLTKKELEADIHRLNGNDGNLSEFKVRSIGKDLFEISKAGRNV